MTIASALDRYFGGLNRILYRATGGKVGGRWGKADVLLLTTTGRKSGKQRTMPVFFMRDGERLAVVASSGGSTGHPGWYLNLRAQPRVQVQIGRERTELWGRDANEEEHAALWPRFVEAYKRYERYKRVAGREIPIVILEPAPE